MPLVLAPTAAAEEAGLGRPELAEQQVSEVEKVAGLGAERARKRVAETAAANEAQAKTARTEQRTEALPTVPDKRTGPAHMLRLTGAAAGGGESPSGSGDYTATPLSPAAEWEAGGSSGAFTWSYDFPAPPVAAGPKPSLALSYNSGSIDGRTASTNNQGTLVGEGFSLTSSYISRAYGSCDEDGHDKVFDQCWKYDNARLVLNGVSNALVKDEETGEWRLEQDDASKVVRSTGADNGDDDGEYWTVTTGDGTRYVFGRNKLPGAGTESTNSVWTTTVFGDDAGEPGYSEGDSFKDRAVTQAWRWNLDYVVDPHGNAMTYWYAKETNYYKKNKATFAETAYTRGGYLRKVLFGQREDTLFTTDATAKVTFGYAERCTAGDCSELTDATSHNWPDVPYESLCDKGDEDCAGSSPTFFTRKRLASVSTYVLEDGEYTAVNAWKLTQEYLDGGDIGDTTDQTLVLKSVRHTGKAGEDITLAPVKFTYQMRPNRVDATDDIVPLTRPRIATVTSETGAITTVTLSRPECVRGSHMPKAEDDNALSCYPQYWNINGAAEASLDWFHKYRVTAVTAADPFAHNEAVEYAYSYSGPAWHYSDDPFTPEEERTWSDWRGYREVTVTKGAKDTTQSRTVSIYLQGMDGDKQQDGTTRSVTVPAASEPDLGIPAQRDSDAFSGMLREKIVYNGSQPIEVTVNHPWSQRTATQNRPSADDLYARFTGTEKTVHYTHLKADGTWRARATTTSFDDYGMPVKVGDSGLVGTSGDETCTRTWYARNETIGVTALKSRVRTVGRACSVTEGSLDLPTGSATRGDVLSDTATVYDDPDATGWTPSQKPTIGEATWQGRPTAYPASTVGGERHPTAWQATSTKTYDALGRELAITDAAGRTSSTAYTPSGQGPLTRTTVTNAKGHKVYTYLDPRLGEPVRIYDANLKKTELAYDALGRLTAVWLPNRNRAAGYSPNTKYAYKSSATKATWRSTSTLKADGETYHTSYEIFDALLRPLQTQTPTPLGGRLLTDIRYDSRGLAYEAYGDIFDDTTEPNNTYTRALYGESPNQVASVFDGAERKVKETVYVYGEERWSTTTTYTGDSTATTAVDGGMGVRVIKDVHGRTVERREYASTSPGDSDYGTGPGAPYASTLFTYTLDGLRTSVTGPDGETWGYGYDLFGREVLVDDPDMGTTTTGYNMLDQVVSSTDAEGRTVLTDYDELGRVVGTWAGEKNDANRLTARTYDTVAIGKPATSTRYVGGQGGKTYTRAVTGYDDRYHATDRELRLPADAPLVAAGVPQTLKFTAHYTIDGGLRNTTAPAVGGLAAETIEYEYNRVGQLDRLTGSTGYLLRTSYSALGKALQLTLGTSSATANKTYVTNTYEEGTGRLLRSHVTDQQHGYMLQDLNYRFDAAGNVTAIFDPTTLGGDSVADNQCFAYDGYRRLIQAWTPRTEDCSATNRSVASLGGAAPYWSSFTYNDAGLRTSKTSHGSTGPETTDYCYQGRQPHTLTATTTGECAGTAADYAYDLTGNTITRPGPVGTQQLSWTPEGKLSRLEQGADNTEYVYDAEGKLLIRRASAGETVLYLGGTEVHLRVDGSGPKIWAQRYYSAGNTKIALRSNQSGQEELYFLVSDHHGTSGLAIEASTQKVVKRYTKPFGGDRSGGVGAWVDDKGFLGKTRDVSTGLTHVGAREYDPRIGMFISVDPLLETDKAQTLNGYSYGSNNPATFSDPTGKGLPGCHKGTTECTGPYPDYDGPAPGSSSGGGGSGGGNGGSSGTVDDGYDAVRSLFFGNVPPGAERVLLKGPKAEGGAIIVARFFIPEKTAAFGMLYGDNRGFTTDPDAGYRIALAWDTAKGEISYTVSPSHTTPTDNVCNNFSCFPDTPGAMIPALPIEEGGANYIEDGGTYIGQSSIYADVGGLNSYLPCCSVEFDIAISVSKDSNRVAIKGDAYPNFEVNKYRRGHKPQVLARSEQGWPGGSLAGLYSSPVAPNREMYWDNGVKNPEPLTGNL